jgi:hypothetical protein
MQETTIVKSFLVTVTETRAKLPKCCIIPNINICPEKVINHYYLFFIFIAYNYNDLFLLFNHITIIL